MRVEWRREEMPPRSEGAAERADSGALSGSLHDEIGRDGPITFARFMERALYDPQLGYYAAAATRPTRSGDFLTAPELHPVFGRTLAFQVDEMWQRLGRPSEFAIREYGAGSGALFLAILDGLLRMDSPLAASITYQPADLPEQLATIRDRLASAGTSERLVTPLPQPFVGVVIANEFLDALPVHRVIRLDGALREIHVDWRDDTFVEVAGPLTNERLARWFSDAGVELAENQRAEVNLAMLDWVSDLRDELELGYALIVDYGAAASDLYGPSRPTGTIRAFAGQRVSSDVLSDPGTRDITSHVDFDALERHARACGFEIVGRRRANEFLIAAGLDDTYAQARAETDKDWDAALNLRSAIQRLLDPNALGGYLVTVLARNATTHPPLLGFKELKTGR